MKVAIVHYHLGHGGVSEVITAASRLLTGAGIPHVILAGPSPADPPPDLPVHIVEGLGYGNSTGDAGDLLERLRCTGGAPDLWHFHNHSLGKNPIFPELVARLAAQNERLLLQIHDLAEDGRPQNASRLAGCRNLYPVGPRVHYAFLNSRDRSHFMKAGLPEANAHLLANPIEPRPPSPSPADLPLLLYPVRGIRRKNLGELLLLTALAPAGTRAAVTRAPLNPRSQPFHDNWRGFSEDIGLPVAFDVVERIAPEANTACSFESWLARATHLVTTSVAEGFGLVFLESIARGKPLLGRNLPHLTRDHAARGIRAGRLYDRLLVPVEWLDGEILDRCLGEALDASWTAWRRSQPPSAFETVHTALYQDGFLDFGNLPEVLQQRAIRRLREPGMKLLPLVEIGGRARPAAEWLEETLEDRRPTATPAQLAPYSAEIHRDNLTGIYRQLMEAPSAPVRPIDKGKILDAYLTPAHFHFLTSPAAARRPAADFTGFRAVVFDIYGTLLIAPAGGVKPDPAADPELRKIITRFGHKPPDSPSTELHAAVLRHHDTAGIRHPEIDLRELWREVLSLSPDTDTSELVMETETAWHPARLMPGAAEILRALAATGIPLGLLSNAQCNTLPSLGELAPLFAPDITILSYQHGIAKPSPGLFDLLANRLVKRDIPPAETLYVGNDPLHDIEPATARGFRTALFTGHPDSLRDGFCFPDFEIRHWSGLTVP
jgi:FMN phosphatase YigB (HAD superfamily)/glycosyltransferase involved in cell wall biosynthesis